MKGYHRMDELLRSSEFKDELAEYRKAASGDGVGGGNDLVVVKKGHLCGFREGEVRVPAAELDCTGPC